MRQPSWMLTAIVGFTVAACGSDSTGPGGDAVIVGSVGTTSAAPSAPGSSGPSMQSNEQASIVVLGEVSGSGNFVVIAESDIDSGGRYRFDEVPAGRSNLVVQARTSGQVVLGSAVLKEETVAGVTHRSHPINTRSTVHAKVWMEARSSGGATGSMGAAELALFLDSSAEVSGGASENEIEALAQASIEAQQAITAAFAAHGVTLSAAARNTLIATAAAARDESRDTGTGANASQQAYISSAFSAFVNAGAKAEVLAMAYAAAATAMSRGTEDMSSEAHLEVTREALLLNVAIRKAGAAAVATDPLGLKVSTTTTLNAIDARIRAAVGIGALRTALSEERALIESRVVVSVLASLPLLAGAAQILVDTRTRTAVEASNLWVRLDGAVTPAAMGTAVGTANTATIAAVADLADAFPVFAGTVPPAPTTSLLLILGAGASIN